jgi:glycosyltransferase involved in cell wall biosynthesis
VPREPARRSESAFVSSLASAPGGGVSLRRGTPFVVLGDDWGRHASTLQHLFRCVAAEYPVIWLNSFGHRAPRLSIGDARRAFSKLRGMLRKPELPDSADLPRLIVHPRALPWHNLRAVRALNMWSLGREIAGALDRVPHVGEPVLVMGSPMGAGLLGRVPNVASIYYCLDDYAEWPGVSRAMIEPVERAMLAQVDGVVATAAALVVSKRPRSGRIYHLPQGVNYERFATPQPAPPDIAELPRPRIGFAGTLDERCDPALMRAVAEAHPDGSVVFVGAVEVSDRPLRLPNVHFLGRRKYEEVAAYVQAFDVGVVPYRRNAVTEAVDPLKLLEYLAAGIPVVTTALPEAAKYADVVSIAHEGRAFVDLVRDAASAPAALRTARQAVARAHTWHSRAQRFYEIVEEVAAGRGRRTDSVR